MAWPRSRGGLRAWSGGKARWSKWEAVTSVSWASWTLHEGLAWIERVLMLMVEIASRISGAPLGDRAGLEIEVE